MNTNQIRSDIETSNRDLFDRVRMHRDRSESMENAAPVFFANANVKALLALAQSMVKELGAVKTKDLTDGFERKSVVSVIAAERQSPCNLEIRYVDVVDDKGHDFKIVVAVTVGPLTSAIYYAEQRFTFGQDVATDLLPFLEPAITEALPKLIDAALTSGI